MLASRRALWPWLLPALAPSWGWGQQRVPAYAPASAAERRGLPEAQRLERHFLQVAAAHLRLQGDASRLVVARTQNALVREVAKELLARHQTAEPELLRLLSQRGMAPPMLANEQLKLLRAMAKMQGAKLDRVYIDEIVVRAAQAEIPVYERAIAIAEDPQLKGWAERQLPQLRLHLTKASRALPAGATPRAGQRSV